MVAPKSTPAVVSALFLLIVIPAVCSPVALAIEPDAQGFGRACLVVRDDSSAENAHRHPTVFDQTATPGAGKRLALFIEASVDAKVLIAVFNDRDRTLTHDWRPEVVELQAWQEQRLPIAPRTWEWSQPTEAFEMNVVFLARPAEDWEQAHTLVAAMQAPEAAPERLAAQARRLHGILVGWTSAPPAFEAGATPSVWGGVLRGAMFPWREHARTVTLDQDGRGVLMFRYGG